MATRFYLERLTTPAVSPAIQAAWTVTPGAGFFMMFPSKTAYCKNTATGNQTSGSSGTTAPKKMICASYISQPLIAQTIASGSTISMQIRASKSATASTGLLFVYFRWCDENGTNIQEIGNTSNATALSTTLTNRTITITLGSNVSITDNQRLIVEIGESYTAGTTAHTCSVASQISATTTDLPVDNTTTTANLPWIEFSQTLSFRNRGITQ